MATKRELLGMILLKGVTPYSRITNTEAARLTAGFAPLRKMLEQTKIARKEVERRRNAAKPSLCRMLRLTNVRQVEEETKPFRWS